MKEVVFIANDKKKIFCSLWDNVKKPIAVIQIIHGMDEHVKRYDRFARFMNKHGYIVFGDDHRAHGRTAKSFAKIGQPDGDKDLFASIASDEINITKYLKKRYNLPVLILGHSYGSFITQKIIETPRLPISGVCLSGTARYPKILVLLMLVPAFIGTKLFGPNSPARFIERLSPIRGTTHNKESKLTRDYYQASLHEKDPAHKEFFSYGFYYSFFKNMLKLPRHSHINVPILIISGGQDPVSFNCHFLSKLLYIYKSATPDKISLNIYPGARHELLMETNYMQVQNDVLNFFDSDV